MPHKILIVDDSRTLRTVVKNALKVFDCVTIEASNGREGLAAAAKETPDMILLDITMPVMDGGQLLNELKTDPALKAIPVVMLTAEGGRDNLLKFAKMGVRDYIVKPFTSQALVEKCEHILSLKRREVTPTGA